MICLDNQPLSMVEDKGFTKLINYLDPKYDIPGRKYFTTIELPKLYEEIKNAVSMIIKGAKCVSVTTDLWTSTANDDYLGLTAHFFHNGLWKHICLEVIPFPQVSHTGEAISHFLKHVLDKWNLHHNHVVVRDNGKNIVAAMEIGNFVGVPCLAHSLQLVVKDGVFHKRNVMALLSNCRRIVGHFKHSAEATKILQSAQKALSIPLHRLVQDEPTRWNSAKHMMDRLLEQKRAIVYASPDLSLPVHLTNSDWELMESIVKILKIFEDATFHVSSSSTSISEVIPIINSAKAELELAATQSRGLQTFANDLLMSLSSRYADVEDIKEYALATLLDPRLKGTVFVNTASFEHAKSTLIQKADDLSKTQANEFTKGVHPTLVAEASRPCSSTSAVDEHKSSPKGMKFKMWKRYSQLSAAQIAMSTPTFDTAEREVSKYLLEPLCLPSTSVGEFLEQGKNNSPRLSNLAFKARQSISSSSHCFFGEAFFYIWNNM